MKVDRILFPTDFSDGAQHALHCAVDLAEHYKSKLIILHVVYDVSQIVGMHVPHISTDEVFKEMNEWAMKEIGSCCIEETRALPDVEKKVVKGIPHEEILKFASDEKIDMIVMGTYGRVGIQRLMFGNTAEKVVRVAPCPVMTVKVPKHRE